VADRRAVAQLRRLMTWLEAFKECFGRRAQVLALRRYVQGLLSDSARKSMEAMLARVTDPGSYQAFQYFITEGPWDAERVWRRLRALVPERQGIVIFDGTSFPQQGTHSVGVARQYCGALGKIANCQVAVTAALWTTRAYLLGAALYLSEDWLTEAARQPAHIPATIRFQEKWRLALTLLRQIRASGIHVTAVVADAEFGDNGLFRAMLHRLRLPYAVGISSQVTVFRGLPRLVWPRAHPQGGRPRKHAVLAPGVHACSVSDLAASDSRWRRIQWRNRRDSRPWAADFMAVRVTPGHEWRHGRLAPPIWLLCERDLGESPRTKFYFVHLPVTATLRQIVHLAHQRWAIEQQYQELKTELGLDHFEGRTFPGWHHHVVLTAVAYNFLQAERGRAHAGLTFPAVRGIVQEIFTAYLFAQQPQYLKRIEALRSVQLQI
jgi:SRSO17 transposase